MEFRRQPLRCGATATVGQASSFETLVNVRGVGEVPGVFIRAPKIETWTR